VTSVPKWGELWWCEPTDIGRRPVVVLSRDAAIPRLRRALIAPCTTTVRGLPSEVLLEPGDDPVPLRSAVNLDSVESVSIAVLVDRIGALSGSRMREICGALNVGIDHGDNISFDRWSVRRVPPWGPFYSVVKYRWR